MCHPIIYRRRNRPQKTQKKRENVIHLNDLLDLSSDYIDLSSPKSCRSRPTSPRELDPRIPFWSRVLFWQIPFRESSRNEVSSKNHLVIPWMVESVINHGILICISGLLYELTVMPLEAILTCWRFIVGKSLGSELDQANLLRFVILCFACIIFQSLVDFSTVYHYIRAQSLLKVYFIFNMLEIIERLVRSWGNEIVDRMVAAIPKRGELSLFDSLVWFSTLLFYIGGTLIYTLVHCYMHFWRVMLVSVAIVSTDSSMFMIVLTNNFAELKGTVFKKYDSKSLYPVIASDIVERLYLFMDVSIVLFRMLTSPQKSKMPFVEVAYWISVMIGLEVFTDWFKYMCVIKFNPIDGVSTLTHFKHIHLCDILEARTQATPQIGPSHLPLRRMNFMPTPLAVIVLVNIMLPNLVGSEPLTLWTYRFLVISALFTAKFLIDWILIAQAARENIPTLPEKLLNVKSL